MRQEHALEHALAGTGKVIDFSGKWVNELESAMTVVQTNGVLSGTYESKKSSTGATAIGDLVGYVDGDLISFTVHWRAFQAITAWVGQLDSKAKKQTIHTLWQLTKQVVPGEEWASINAGSDSFTRLL
ncbi:avidin/streptavidin family protein [Chitinimonas sp. BJB300]|uniref:avidin/streptavidin family protein n=1 Tax=Chitinimonas sp. BJB300 TaxID=1559339 RepID=UPI000C11DEFF|nr:avidin/streptavidin family protein [Chitinimonas sp. BJB300]PHV13143.1 avidin [Chitinimonas sp. BJB300]TSJ84740.1 avidin [Chitinimonas sp. BJB300]